ncbi:hypothetical protein [Ruegeria sp. HKCCA0370]|uniref:hypothetical protein n=1 Tax=Ruegeria sp. HKCCA0370 TaxID=2682995 RepID=UPI001487BEE2|nr:hypothetical protein [Ruegeria sp. HKCCA0370]
MITRKALLLNAFVLSLVSFPQISAADGFTSADVLEWPEASQNNYFQTSVTMIGIVATQVEGREHIAECIDSWMGGGQESVPKRAAVIRSVMEGIPEYHPQAVILAVIEKECGKFCVLNFRHCQSGRFGDIGRARY